MGKRRKLRNRVCSKIGGLEEAVEEATKTAEPGTEQVLGGDQGRSEPSGAIEVQSDRGDRDPREGCYREDVPGE